MVCSSIVVDCPHCGNATVLECDIAAGAILRPFHIVCEECHKTYTAEVSVEIEVKITAEEE